MKLLVLAIILLSLYLIYRLSFPSQTKKTEGNKTSPSPSPNGYEPVVKRRFVLPDRSSSAQHDDRTEDSDIQVKKTDTFAAGNDNPTPAVIPPDEIDEVFGEVNPEELEIVRDENEADENDGLDEEEEAGEIDENAGVVEGYADGFTFDELATSIHEADTQPEAMTKASLKTLRNLSKTDMFEDLVSVGEGRAMQIAAILDRGEQSLAGQSEDTANDSSSEYRDFDMTDYLS